LRAPVPRSDRLTERPPCAGVPNARGPTSMFRQAFSGNNDEADVARHGARSTPLRGSRSSPDHSGAMRTREGSMAVVALVVGAALVVAACSGQSVTGAAHVLTAGTWGGENAG